MTARPPKPTALAVRPENIPEALTRWPQWVVWRYEWNQRQQKWDKPPRQVRGGGLASPTDRRTWATYEDALAAYQNPDRHLDGIGFCLSQEVGIVGGDFDHVRRGDALDPDVRHLITGTYCELSPSGQGVHALWFGKLPGKGGKNGKFEVYDQARYLTITGHRLQLAEPTLAANPGHVAELYARVRSQHRGRGPARSPAGADRTYTPGQRGSRIRAMFGKLNSEGLGLDVITAAVLDENKKHFDPPKTEDEIRAEVADLWNRYHDQNGQARREVRDVSRPPTGIVPTPDPKPAVLPEPSSEVFHGLAGRVAHLLTRYVESDAGSLLVQALTTFGTAAGIRPCFMQGPTRHSPAVYTGLIGQSSRGRKGTGGDAVEALFREVDPTFSSRIETGIGSGEKLVHLVRDPDPALGDEGAPDRRLLLRQGEMASLLAVVNRENNTLSGNLRDAFDGKPLANTVKRDPARSTVHHIGLIGHCTPEEIRVSLTERQVHNGLANRIGWFLAKRARKLARPPLFEGPAIDDAVAELRTALRDAQGRHRLSRSPNAEAVWEEWYNALPDDEVGLVSVLTARAEALVQRWSLIYALMGQSPAIEVEHLCAAIALYEYERACVEHIWGQTTGEPLYDRLLDELAYGDLFQTEVHGIYQGHLSAYTLEKMAYDLEHAGRIVRLHVPPQKGSKGGRPALLWRRLK